MIVGFARTLYLNYSNQLWDSPWLGLNLYGANAYTNGHFNLLRGLYILIAHLYIRVLVKFINILILDCVFL